MATDDLDMGQPLTAPALTAAVEQAQMQSAYEMRITSGGQLKGFINFALKFLQENPGRPLVLSTLPAPSSKQPPKPISESESSSDEEQNTDPPPLQSNPPKQSNKLHPSLSLAPRLITVVEIIKREYLNIVTHSARSGRPIASSSTNPASLEADGSTDTKWVEVKGLEQWNYVGSIESLKAAGKDDQESSDEAEMETWDSAEKTGQKRKRHERQPETPQTAFALDPSLPPEERAERIIELLSKQKKFVKLTRNPFMKIVLCTGPIQDIESALPGVSYQPPDPPTRVRVNTKRANKSKKKTNGRDGGEEVKGIVDHITSSSIV